MKKIMSLTFFAFTPAYGPVADDSAAEVACKGLYGFMNTDKVAAR